MIDFKVLKKYGTDDTAIKALFRESDENPEREQVFERLVEKKESVRKRGSSLEDLQDEKHKLSDKERDELWEKFSDKMDHKRKVFIDRIESRIHEGRLRGLKDYRFFYATDLAWDSQPAIEEKVPLTLFAQGKLTEKDCIKDLEEATGVSDYVVEDEGGHKHLQLGRLHDVAMNLVRPFITRRVAAQVSKYAKLYPFYKYESRLKTDTGNLVGAALSQRVDMISDQYGYRHEFIQVLRRSYLHTSAVSFVESSWDRERQIRLDANGEEESYTSKEGLNFVHPHIARVFQDSAYPLSSLNHDSGINYVGYWDVMRKQDVWGNSGYFNRDTIKQYSKNSSVYSSYKTFFDIYYPDMVVGYEEPSDVATVLARDNSRKDNQGLLAACEDDQSLFVTTYFEKIIPKEVGIGDYPHPVWVRLILANDCTVIHGEILPSKPAAVMEYNRDDSRIRAASMAHEILPFQDQVDNLFSQLVYLMRLESFLLLSVDTDLVSEEIRDELKTFVQNGRYHSQALLAEFSSSNQEQLQGKNQLRDTPFKFQATDLRSQIVTTVEGITKMIQLLEKTQMMSPQELGQFNQRETSASEVFEVANTTNAIHGFLSHGPDEYRAAMKEIIYESLIARGEDTVYVPVVETFQDAVIEGAGFKIQEKAKGLVIDGQSQEGWLISGSKKALVHEYLFNSRDGSERTVSREVANGLLQFLGSMMGNEQFINMIGPEQMAKLIAESFRLLGTTLNLKLDPEQQGVVPPREILDQVMQQVQQNSQVLAQLQQAIQQAVGAEQALPTPPQVPAVDPATANAAQALTFQ